MAVRATSNRCLVASGRLPRLYLSGSTANSGFGSKLGSVGGRRTQQEGTREEEREREREDHQRSEINKSPCQQLLAFSCSLRMPKVTRGNLCKLFLFKDNSSVLGCFFLYVAQHAIKKQRPLEATFEYARGRASERVRAHSGQVHKLSFESHLCCLPARSFVRLLFTCARSLSLARSIYRSARSEMT